ncbi:hypothetical protein D3C85_1343140 [compost metagenome]
MLRQTKLRYIQFTPVTVYRKAAGSYVDGVWQEAAETTLTVNMKVQPAKEADLKMLPEADRSSGMVKVFSQDVALKTLDQANATVADEFVWQGYRYQVVQVNFWDTTRINHYECIAKRLEVTPN